MSQKIKTEIELISLVAELQKNDQKVVALSGAFDLIHDGHIGFLEQAKKEGDVLVIFLNSDESIKKYKDKNRPILSGDKRAIVLSALACVDYVVIFNDENPIRILGLIKPDVYCNGVEYQESFIEKEVLASYGGRAHFIDYRTNSTTDIILKIKKL